jgi:hypothetical protein
LSIPKEKPISREWKSNPGRRDYHCAVAVAVVVGTERLAMSIADGAILFVACMLSFAVGYSIGVFRVCRYVNRELTRIHLTIEEHSRALQQFISRLDEGEKRE